MIRCGKAGYLVGGEPLRHARHIQELNSNVTPQKPSSRRHRVGKDFHLLSSDAAAKPLYYRIIASFPPSFLTIRPSFIKSVMSRRRSFFRWIPRSVGLREPRPLERPLLICPRCFTPAFRGSDRSWICRCCLP